MPEKQEVPSDSGGMPLPGAMFDLGLKSSFVLPRRDWALPETELLEEELPQYEGLSFVARGGMGAVYRGCQKSLNRSVAIKVLPREIAQSEWGFSDRFRREAEAMAHLSHPYIVSIFDAGTTSSGLLYFVMEFVEGTDVQRLLAKEGRLQPMRALEITSMVCDALDFAHGHGVIHRDIKPSNVMLDQHSRTKVADFGLARLLGEDNLTSFTSSHLAMGTVNYIAPEAMIPGTKLDHRADLYSVGVMLYNMVTGQAPYGRFDMPSTLLPGVDHRLDSIIDRAMRMDRDKRYGSAAELKEEVNDLLERSGGRSRPQTRFSVKAAPAPIPRRRSWVRGSLIGAAALVVVAGAAIFMIPKNHPKAEAKSAPSLSIAQAPSPSWGTPPAAPTPAPASKDQPLLPTGIWIPVKWSKEDAVANGAELSANGGLKLAHGVSLQDTAHHEIYARDVALRAHLQSTDHTPSSSLIVRQSGPRGRRLVFTPHYAQLSNSPPSRETWSAPVPHEEGLGIDQSVTLEVAVIGRITYGLVDGKLMPPIVADDPSEKGTLLIGSQDAEFSDVEVMILDGIPLEKAMPLAGLTQDGRSSPAK